MDDRDLSVISHYYNKYHNLNLKGKEIFDSIMNLFTTARENDKLKKILIIENIKNLSSELRFDFIGITFYIKLMYNNERGIIEWGVLREETGEIKRVKFLTEHFDSRGNIFNEDDQNIDVLTSEYQFDFIFQLASILDKYFKENSNTADIKVNNG